MMHLLCIAVSRGHKRELNIDGAVQFFKSFLLVQFPLLPFKARGKYILIEHISLNNMFLVRRVDVTYFSLKGKTFCYV